MKIVGYKCNMCGDIKSKNELICMYWDCRITPQQWILSNDLNSSDRHICKSCISVIKVGIK